MKLLKTLLRNQTGQALPTVLILLLLGGFFVVPSLTLMSTSLNANRVVEGNTLELYAADAGVEKVLWHIRHDGDFTLPAEGAGHSFPQFQINDKTVEPSITRNAGEEGYRITSTATSDDGDSTTVESYVELLDLSNFLDSAITSNGDVEISPNCTISGNVTYSGTIDNKGEIIDGCEINEDTVWPDAEDLTYYYWWHVKDLSPYPSDTISVADGTEADPVSIGPLYRDGDLNIAGNGYGRLDGTVYVTGDFAIAPNPTIDLNGQTILAEGTVTIQPGASLRGSGCIIAMNKNNETVACDIQPNMEQDTDDFVLIMAYTGAVFLKPNGDFYGCVVGEALVDMQPNSTLYWREVGEGELNFPGEDDTSNRVVKILTYTIK